MAEFQNTTKALFPGVGKYEFPQIAPVYELPEVKDFIEFNYCKRIRNGHKDLGVHFFEFDTRFERCWTSPDKYGEMLKKFGYILGPDFSQYIDFPVILQMYNHYRNNWLCAYWQKNFNITVVPTIMWGYPDSWEWCFDGFPTNSIVAVSTLGVLRDDETRDVFFTGWVEMLKRLDPSLIILFSRDFQNLPGADRIRYVRWNWRKGDQLYGNG